MASWYLRVMNQCEPFTGRFHHQQGSPVTGVLSFQPWRQLLADGLFLLLHGHAWIEVGQVPQWNSGRT